MSAGTLHRLAAFADEPGGGNPAGVWVGDALPSAAAMRRIAARVGYSETIFLAPARGPRRTVRYFSPEAEVTFCGHATIAAGVVLGEAEGDGKYTLDTPAGEVAIAVRTKDGIREASLISVTPQWKPADAELVGEALDALGWRAADLDTSIPAALAYAGAWHLVLAAATAQRLGGLAYDFARLKALMLREDITTVQLVWREHSELYHSRNPFPVGGVVEDPATGAAAAALGGYLRDAGLLPAPAALTILQGEAMGRPSRIRVDIPAAGGIVVTGVAIPIEP